MACFLKYIWNNSYLYCGCRWKWRVIIAVNFPILISNWKEEALKISRLQWESNLWPPQYRCDVLPTELWSHTLGARSICWVHIFPCCGMTWSIQYVQYFIFVLRCHSTKMNYFIYTSLHFTAREDMKPTNDLAPNVWLHSSVDQYRGGHGFDSRWSPDIYRASSFQLLKLENVLRWSPFTFGMFLVMTKKKTSFSISLSCNFCLFYWVIPSWN